MDSSLLATKVQIPPKAAQVVHRSRLIDSLEAELPRCKLGLVAAPAGYGKTTLLSQWAHASQFPVAWLSLSEEENELERFLRYLYHAWEIVQPDIRESTLGVMLEGRLEDTQAILSALVQLVIDTQGQTVFVLDDYHLVDDPEIHTALTFLLDHLPQTAHIVLSTRADPPLPLPRYRARAELLELRTEDLMFWQDETQEFFKQWMDLELSRAELETLQNQAEGWATGLRLFGLTYRQRSSKPVQPEMTGKHRFISDYLGQEVLSGLPEDLRRFLLQTSILDRLSGPLCDAVTGETNGQAALERLERANLFLVPLDETRDWYRYHRLFADFLRGELSRRNPELVADLHNRAARWHLEFDLPEQAYNHALAADDQELMALVFDRHANAKLMAGEFSIMKRWLDTLPKQWFSAYPVLDLARAGYLAYTGSFDACLRVVNEVEVRLRASANEDAPRQLARVKSVRCFMACMSNDLPQAESFAGQALRDLPEEDLGFRPGIYAALGDTYRQNGLWDEARQCYLKALDFAQAPAVRVQSAHVYGALADLDLQQGRLQNAAGHWKKALAFIQDRENWGHLPLPVSGWIHTRMAELFYEWNELDLAGDHLGRGLERAELSGDVRTQMAGYILNARLNLSLGEFEKATGYIEQARHMVEQAPFPEWTDQFERCQIELWLAENRLRAAVLWADDKLHSAPQDRAESVVAQLSVARVLIVKGDRPSVERALALLENLLQTSEDEGRVGMAIETLALQALAEWRRGGWPSALTGLERALRLAEPEGYLRLFVDLGLPMGRLLQEARSRDIMVDYVARLLDVFGSALASQGAPVQILPEPLTPREQEILELLAAGLTNREIAGQFVISPETVKKHVSSIYGKLGISNRTEAAALARELGLLG
jgi:LuxR family transcriptional regulator, maltose regulon positive regulatory protein